MVPTTTFRQITKFGMFKCCSKMLIKCNITALVQKQLASFPTDDLTVLLGAGMLSLLCGIGNLNKIWYACEPH
jgi:hypothetical protein